MVSLYSEVLSAVLPTRPRERAAVGTDGEQELWGENLSPSWGSSEMSMHIGEGEPVCVCWGETSWPTGV